MGFDAVEYPLRNGYQVQPSDGVKGIVRLARTLEKAGVAVTSLAAGIDVHTVEGKGEVDRLFIRAVLDNPNGADTVRTAEDYASMELVEQLLDARIQAV